MSNKNNFILSIARFCPSKYKTASLLSIALFMAGCNYTLPVKDGNTAWELRRYNDAIPVLKKEFEKAKLRSEKGKIAFKIAKSMPSYFRAKTR